MTTLIKFCQSYKKIIIRIIKSKFYSFLMNKKDRIGEAEEQLRMVAEDKLNIENR